MPSHTKEKAPAAVEIERREELAGAIRLLPFEARPEIYSGVMEDLLFILAQLLNDALISPS